uniref:Uncharacterized protein n=1 Tax=Mizugakiibacter sediminis TaxID=1475481 RepID=A0A0S6YZF1_9GAMM
MPVPAYKPLPAALTTPLAEPAPPPAHCVLGGVPAVCVIDALAWVEQWRALLQAANADRADAARLSAPIVAPGTAP